MFSKELSLRNADLYIWTNEANKLRNDFYLNISVFILSKVVRFVFIGCMHGLVCFWVSIEWRVKASCDERSSAI